MEYRGPGIICLKYALTSDRYSHGYISKIGPPPQRPHRTIGLSETLQPSRAVPTAQLLQCPANPYGRYVLRIRWFHVLSNIRKICEWLLFRLSSSRIPPRRCGAQEPYLPSHLVWPTTPQSHGGLPSHQHDIYHSKGKSEPCLPINRGPVVNNELAMEARYLKDALHAKEQALAKTTAALDPGRCHQRNALSDCEKVCPLGLRSAVSERKRNASCKER
jgi:hypothetical protein